MRWVYMFEIQGLEFRLRCFQEECMRSMGSEESDGGLSVKRLLVEPVVVRCVYCECRWWWCPSRRCPCVADDWRPKQRQRRPGWPGLVTRENHVCSPLHPAAPNTHTHRETMTRQQYTHTCDNSGTIQTHKSVTTHCEWKFFLHRGETTHTRRVSWVTSFHHFIREVYKMIRNHTDELRETAWL